MRAFVAAAVMLCLSGPSSAYDMQTKTGQAVCDTLLEFEELTIAISMNDDDSIVEMGDKGCHLPEPGLRMELVEAYPDQTILLFSKLAEYTRIGPVPTHIERLTSLAKVRLLRRDASPMEGFTMLRVSQALHSQLDQVR
jgi:hypothetical protein